MGKRYEVRHSTGYVRGTRRQVSQWLHDLHWEQLREEWHARDAAIGRAWDALLPSQRAMWLEKARAWLAEHPREPDDQPWSELQEARSQFEMRLSRPPWWQFLGEAAPRATLPWVVHSDTDKAHRCPLCQSMAGTGDEIEEHGHPGVNKRHVYQCTRCGQRFRNRNGLLDFDDGRPVWFPRLRWRLRVRWRYSAVYWWLGLRRDCREYGLYGALAWQVTWTWEQQRRRARRVRRNWHHSLSVAVYRPVTRYRKAPLRVITQDDWVRLVTTGDHEGSEEKEQA